MLTNQRSRFLLAGAGLIGAVGVTVAAIDGSSGSVVAAVAFSTTSVLLGAAVGSLGLPGTRAAVVALLVLGAVVFTVAAVNAVAGSAPAALSALGAVLAFLVCPAACAYGLRTSRDLRLGAIASVAVPVIFIASLILDGPVLQGVGPTIDAIDAVVVPIWLFVVASNLLLAGRAVHFARSE